MNDRERLDQLRGLLDRLERMPACADRDWMLAEVRARAVDVETGMPPAPLRALPQDELEAEGAAERSPRTQAVARVRRHRRQPNRRAQRARVVQAVPVPAHERRREEVVDLLEQGGVICLDDPPTAAPGARRPWSGGLRG